MVEIKKTNRICSPGVTYEATIDGEAKAYLIQEKDTNEPRLHIPGMIPLSQVIKILKTAQGIKLNEVKTNY